MKLKSDPSKTVLTITVGFVIVYAFTQFKWALSTAAFIGLAGVFSSFLAKKIEWVWMKLTWVLSFIVPNILLSIVFFVFLFPLAILSKLVSGKNLLQLKNNESSTYSSIRKQFTAKDLENPW